MHFYLSITNQKEFFEKNHFWAIAGPKTGNTENSRKNVIFSIFTGISMNILKYTGLNDTYISTNNILRLSKHRKTHFRSQTTHRHQNSFNIGRK